MNIYVVPEIDIERFKETGVFAVRLLNNEAMTHDGIYLESDGAKAFAEFFQDNIFSAGKFEELVEWGLKADAESASLVRTIIHSRVWEYEQNHAMTMDQVLVQLCTRWHWTGVMPQKQITLTYISTAEQETAQMTGGSYAANMRLRKGEAAMKKEVDDIAGTQTQNPAAQRAVGGSGENR